MSLSMPTTLKPRSAKWRTDSAPMRPAAPVTMAIFMAMGGEGGRGGSRSLCEDRFELGAVVDDPARDLGDDRVGGQLGPPAGGGHDLAAVAEVADQVLRPRLGRRRDLDRLAGVP